ncbi:16S rRNA (adenine(1518)-N(6)/adenine(1519)-N(6))-dimethyltransferase RsmA [Buchnera aphidicola]|uniref:16S rRNA (adenine(1518)-N(6)/adenine(1519)-N(6))- dimethyltransferase RsmA n=1 Tax=Buchnera aphidicola TaxID=9 RepID=UPI0031B8093F
MNTNFLKKINIKKSLGQNFLVDNDVLKKIVKYINPKFNDKIFEIGAGTGCLTKILYNHVKTMSIIEIDSSLYNVLKKYFLDKNVIIFNENILHFDFKKYLKNYNFVRIVGNVPYNISINIIFYFLNFLDNIKDMHFMLQYEVAKKISAKIGSKCYGKLSILLQYYFRIKILLEVNSKSFFPVPKVNSCFVKFIPTKRFFKNNVNIKYFKYIVSTAFSQRRKTIKNSLSNIFKKDIFKILKIDSSLRAQNLTILEYCRLTKYFVKNIFI